MLVLSNHIRLPRRSLTTGEKKELEIQNSLSLHPPMFCFLQFRLPNGPMWVDTRGPAGTRTPVGTEPGTYVRLGDASSTSTDCVDDGGG